MSLPYKKIAVFFTDFNELEQRWPGIMIVAQECGAELHLLRGIAQMNTDQEMLFSEMKVLRERLLATHLPFELRYVSGETMTEFYENAKVEEIDLLWMPFGRFILFRDDYAQLAT